MNPIIIMLADRCVGKSDFRRITNDALYPLQNALRKNAPADCIKTDAELTVQVLELAATHLKDSDIFVASLADGTELHFIGRVPMHMTPEMISELVFHKFQKEIA